MGKRSRLGDCRTWEVNGLRIANLTTAASPVIEEVRLTPLNRPLVENRPVRFPKSDRLLVGEVEARETQTSGLRAGGSPAFLPDRLRASATTFSSGNPSVSPQSIQKARDGIRSPASAL